MEVKKNRGRPRMMLLDWMMKEDYSKLKPCRRAGHRGAIGRMNMIRKAENQEEEEEE